jgi:hypothetical protein
MGQPRHELGSSAREYSWKLLNVFIFRPKNLCDCSIARTAGSSPAESVDIRILCLLCVVQVPASATS